MEDIEHQIQTAPLSYEEAKEQWVKKSEELDLKHAFTFDEMWETATEIRRRNEFRNLVSAFQDDLENSGIAMTQEEIMLHNPIEETWAGGCYIRKIINPANELLVTKIHKKRHPFFLMRGEMSILTDEGIKRIKAPHYGITEVGTKRIIYTHEECEFITVHATDKLTSEEVEEDVIAKDFQDPVIAQNDINKLRGI